VFDGKSWSANGEWADAVAPATGEVMARVRMGSVQDLQRCTQAALDARADWAAIPAPRRGEIVRQIGNKFREVRSGYPPALRTRLSSRLQLKFQLTFATRTSSRSGSSFRWKWAKSRAKGAGKCRRLWG